MTKEALIYFIKQNTPNVAVSKESLTIISDQFEKKVYAKGDYFLKEGSISGYLYLDKGFLRAFTFDLEGNEVTTYFYPEGRIIFDASSFFLHVPSTENIQAVTECTAYYTTFEKLNTLFHSVPEFREFGRQMIVKEFVAYKQRTLAMINKSPEERYQNLITHSKEIFQYAQLKHIASYLGISERSLSRIRNEFSRKLH